jgi:hypothetical protein
MNKREMKNLIFDMLGKILSETDFRHKKSEDAFVRKIIEGWQQIGLPLYDYKPEFIFSLNICIRLNVVEEIFNGIMHFTKQTENMEF